MLPIGRAYLADCRDGVDGRDSLSKKGVGDELGQLGRPEVGGDDALAWNPLVVDRDERLDRLETVGGLSTTDQDTVRHFEVVHCRTLGQKLWVGQDLCSARAQRRRLLSSTLLYYRCRSSFLPCFRERAHALDCTSIIPGT